MHRVDRPQRRPAIALAGQDDEDGLRIILSDAREQLGAAHAGHFHVADDHVDRFHAEQVERLGAAAREAHRPAIPPAPEHALQIGAQIGLIVDEQD